MATKNITLICSSCGGQIRITPGTTHYACTYCGTEGIIQGIQPQRSIERAPVPIPESVSVDKNGQAIRITRRWFSAKYIGMVFFCIAWDSFLCFWYGTAFKVGAPWIMIVFPVAHLAVGVGMTYLTLAGLINRSYLEVTAKELATWNDPLPWTGEITLKTSDLAQLYCSETTKSGEHSTTHSYNLFAVTRDGKARKVFSDLETPEIALFMEQQVEKWLRLEDQPVPGELSR
jgi:predicted RNA-binding Zn-ribbon protein involved in translation (DUF1610 family)